MSNLSKCILLEWGPWFASAVLATGTIVAFLFYVLFRFLVGDTKRLDSLAASVEIGPIKVNSGNIRIVAFFLIFILARETIPVVYNAYNDFRLEHYVALDTPQTALENVRSRYQQETNVDIIVADAARIFTISGQFKGYCVQDLLRSIHQKYSPQLTYEESILDRYVKLDLNSPRNQ